ncbi:MAG: hypothetical protein ACRCZI_11130 [Cetobacterium sp.]
MKKNNTDTVEVLEGLLEQAKAGELTGCICIPVYPGRQYVLLYSGHAADDLTWSAGALSVCGHLANGYAAAEQPGKV